jgi:hypothetical protein
MFCNICGEGNPDDAIFCKKCGSPLTSDEFSIDFFIKQNKDLLVCLGVFGALTVYLKQISQTGCDPNAPIYTTFGNFCYLDFGVAGSLIIFLILGFAAFVKLLGINDDGPRPFVFNYGNIIRMILIIPFGALIASIFYYVAQTLSAPSQMLLIFITCFLGALFFFGYLKLISSLKSKMVFKWIGSIILFIILLYPMGFAAYTKNYYLASFVTIFNVFNFLFILAYPLHVVVQHLNRNKTEQISDSIQIVLNQLKRK